MIRHVAFLRAVNVGGRTVKMDRLRSVVESAGVDNVSTFIASGNVIFDADSNKGLTGRIESSLEDDLGFEVPVFLRTAREVISVADLRPFTEPEHNLEISFLPSEPNPSAAKLLVSNAHGSDRLAVIGREVYWSHVEPRSESKHSETQVVRTLGMATTQRSAKTVRTIADRFLR
jgi:uncharacterized protein (DUF1697 family)